MRKLINIIPISVTNGSNGNFGFETLDEGKIKGVSIYKNGVNNPGYVRAMIKDSSGTEIVPYHHIDNYRNRDCAYDQGYMPLDMSGGKKVTVEINSDQAFDADTYFEAVFYYEKQIDC